MNGNFILNDNTEHTFVKKLSNNKLLEEKFLNYLIQDYLFLIQFSKAWSEYSNYKIR